MVAGKAAEGISLTVSSIVVSSMSYMILAGSSLINFLFNYMSVPRLLSEAVVSLSLTPLNVFVLVCLMYLVLGMFIDGISMVVLTVSTVVPLLTSLGFDPIWIGVVLVLLVEIALVTPPVGVNLYVLQGVAESLFRTDSDRLDPLHWSPDVYDRPDVSLPPDSALAAQHDAVVKQGGWVDGRCIAINWNSSTGLDVIPARTDRNLYARQSGGGGD